jgi:hypothetical protein
MADSIGVARREVPDEERRRIDEMEATTYSTETGETTEKQAPKRRRPRRKRRPRPEVIAAHLKDEGEGVTEGDNAAQAAEVPDVESPQVAEQAAGDELTGGED